MQRRLLAALAAFALALQAGDALAAFGVEPRACCCPMGGQDHRCGCPECARHRCDDRGESSLGGCASDSGPLLPGPAAPSCLPAAIAPLARLLPHVSPERALPAPPLAPSRDVPTPPPLA